MIELPPCPRPDAPLLVGFSGGLDSGVLLHLLASDEDIRRRGLRAIHVHHGLHADADAWARHCADVCAALDVPLQVARVQVASDAGMGLEGAARQARHRAFESALAPGEVLVLAHHRGDQAETFLLRALRGSGVDGLGAMRPWRAFAQGWCWRPLLGVPRARLHDCAMTLGLNWIEDPSNAQDAADRNFLRLQVLPLLRQRWPHADAALARSAALAAEASALLDREADLPPDGRLALDALRMLPRERRARVLRAWVVARGLPPLPSRGIDHVERAIESAAADRTAQFAWHGAWIRRWRGALHAGHDDAAIDPDWTREWDGRAPLRLPDGGSVELLGVPAFDVPLRARLRRGGERIVMPGRSHSHALKHMLQDAGIPPWLRGRVVLLCSDDGQVMGAGDRIVSAPLQAWLQERGAHLRWTAGG